MEFSFTLNKGTSLFILYWFIITPFWPIRRLITTKTLTLTRSDILTSVSLALWFTFSTINSSKLVATQLIIDIPFVLFVLVSIFIYLINNWVNELENLINKYFNKELQ